MSTAPHVFKTLFAVPITCDSCVKDVSDSLHDRLGSAAIHSIEADIPQQLITIEGTAAPSVIVEAIQATGRDAILRGSGVQNSAAVSILETYPDSSAPKVNGDSATSRDVRGLVRLVQVSRDATLVDLTIRGLAPGSYHASIRAYGDLKHGATSTGPIWATDSNDSEPKGLLGIVDVGTDGRGSLFVDRPFQVWEVIGHGLVVTNQENAASCSSLHNGVDTLAGVVARSAGVWDNDKAVCSCTGKTLWEERVDEVKKGML